MSSTAVGHKCVENDHETCKETCKRDLQKRPAKETCKRDLQKRLAKETARHHKRSAKETTRHLNRRAKETCKRDLQKQPSDNGSWQHVGCQALQKKPRYAKRDLQKRPAKETALYQETKRPAKDTCCLWQLYQKKLIHRETNIYQ